MLGGAAAARLLPDHVIVTSPNGAKSANKADWSPLAGRAAIIWPDADEAGRGYAVPTAVRTTRIVSSHPPPDYPAEWAEGGVRVRRCHLVLAQQPRLAGAKTLNRLENVLARSEWDDPAIADVIANPVA